MIDKGYFCLSYNFSVFVAVVALGLGHKVADVNLKRASSFPPFAVFVFYLLLSKCITLCY